MNFFFKRSYNTDLQGKKSIHISPNLATKTSCYKIVQKQQNLQTSQNHSFPTQLNKKKILQDWSTRKDPFHITPNLATKYKLLPNHPKDPKEQKQKPPNFSKSLQKGNSYDVNLQERYLLHHSKLRHQTTSCCKIMQNTRKKATQNK